MALGELYEGLGGRVDSFAEAFQGVYDVIEEYPASFGLPEIPPGPTLPPTLVVEWAESLSRFVQEGRKGMPQDSELQNAIDEIQGLIDGVLYKLRRFK
jgi:hypothetical protein